MQRLLKFHVARNFICRYGKQNFQQQKIAFPHAENRKLCSEKREMAQRRFDKVAANAHRWLYKRILPSALHPSPFVYIYKKDSYLQR